MARKRAVLAGPGRHVRSHVDAHLPEKTKVGSVHTGRIAYISSGGDFTLSPKLTDAVKTATMAFMTSIYLTYSPVSFLI